MDYQNNNQNNAGRKSRHGSPLYPPPVRRSKCRTATVAFFRVFVALLALVVVALTIAGQILPFCMWADKKKTKTYSIWRETETKVKKMKVEQEGREDNSGEKLFAILSAVFATVGCVLCFVFAGLWARHEQARRREAATYRHAQRYAEEMQMIDESNPSGTHNNNNNGRYVDEDARRLASSSWSSYGSGEALYQLERHRQKVDRDVGIAAVSLLMAASVASLITIGLMGHFYNEEVADEVDAKDGESASMQRGAHLFIAALVLGVVSFLVLALPFATNLYLCCPPMVEKVYPSTQLSRSDSDENEERRGVPQMDYKGGDNVYVNQNTYHTQNTNNSNHTQNTNNTMNVHNVARGGASGQGVVYPYNNYQSNANEAHNANSSAYSYNSYNTSHNNNNNNNNNSNMFALSSGNNSSPPPARTMASPPPPPSSSSIEHTAVEPLRDEHIAEPRASLMTQQLYFSGPQTEVRQTPHGAATAYGNNTPTMMHNNNNNSYNSNNNTSNNMYSSPSKAPSGGNVSKPPPQPYVPTVVGTYPEALPGPANMDNVTLHHVTHDGRVEPTAATAAAATALPATQAAWRGSETPSNYTPNPTQATREGDEVVKKSAGEAEEASTTKEAYESPVKRYYQ